MAVRINVSDFDITKGVPEWNLTTVPYPQTGSNVGWFFNHYTDGDGPQGVDSAIVSWDDLLDETGVAPRREGNNYAVATVLDAWPGGEFTSINHSPVAPVPFQSYSTLYFSKWIYVKSGLPEVTVGYGVGIYGSGYEDLGAWGDTTGVTVPTNQWVRVWHTQNTATIPLSEQVRFIGTGLAITGQFEAGDLVISTDYMETYDGLIDYFDGNFEDSDNIRFSWESQPFISASSRQAFVPSSVKLFPPMNVRNYEVSEDSMSLDPGDFDGGYGSISFEIDPDPDLVLLRGKTFDLEDTDKGKTSGIVVDLDATEESLTVTTDSMLGVLNSWNTMPAMEGTLSQFVAQAFDIVDLELPVRFEQGVGDIPVVVATYVGNFWDMMKQFLSAYQVEMSLVWNTVVFRPFRTFEAYTGRESASGWSISQGETARAVEVTYYNPVYGPQEFYPERYNDHEYNPTIMQVDAGETVEYVLKTAGTLTNPGVPVTVLPDYTVQNRPYTYSTYSVAGNDDLPIQPQQWLDAGGELSYTVNEDDPTTITVKLKGANIPRLAPFRIAMSSGSGNYYNSLHIYGIGTRLDEKTVRIPTGASKDVAGTDVGVVVQNPFINTWDQAYSLGARTAARFSGLMYSISGTAWDINRRSVDTGIYATVRDFNRSWVGTETVEDFNNRYAGMTVLQFSETWEAAIGDEFSVQAFGNAAGARVRANDAYFRIRQAVFNPADMSYTAELDTMISDFNEVWDGATIADFNEEHFNKFIRDFSLIPLRRDNGD